MSNDDEYYDDFDFNDAVKQWSNPPVDNIGYISSKSLLSYSKSKIQEFVKVFENNRYELKGWRNHKNLWRSTLGLDETKNKTIIDFGCGFGIESLQFAYNGNKVILADISEDNLNAAEYIINCMGFKVIEKVLVKYDDPFFDTENKFDVFYSNGVLHHTPKIKEIINRATSFFVDPKNMEYRLMLYSDNAWTAETGRPINRDIPIYMQKGFYKYVRIMDAVGAYADWYDKEKISSILPSNLIVDSYDYIGLNKRYSTTIIKNSNV